VAAAVPEASLGRSAFSDNGRPAADRALIAFVAETVEKPRASDSAFDAIRPLFNDRQIVEIMHIIGASAPPRRRSTGGQRPQVS
jgi:alkylhydroperoxidase family enzyme